MSAGVLVIVLALGWAAVTGSFNLPNLLLGLAIALLVVFLLRHRLARPFPFRRFTAALSLALFFVGELILSALAVARLALSPSLRRRLAPAIVAFPLTARSDAEITLLANLITLTPGTLTIDVAADRSHLYVHLLTLRSRDELVGAIANGLEKRVIEVFR